MKTTFNLKKVNAMMRDKTNDKSRKSFEFSTEPVVKISAQSENILIQLKRTLGAESYPIRIKGGKIS
jgi:hypothetical protein